MPPKSLKSSASRTSLQSTTPSSVSTAAKSTAIGRGLKRIKKGVAAIVRPQKRAKYASSPVMSDEDEDLVTEDQFSTKTNDPEVIELASDADVNMEDLEKELGQSNF
jgi:hypothetical protein